MEGNTNNNSDLSLEELNRLRENTANAHYYSTQQDLTRLGNIDAQITQLESSQAAPTPTVIPSVQITSQPGQMTPEEVITYMRQNPDMVPAGFQNNESYYNMVYDNLNNDPMTLANYNQRIEQREFIGPMPATPNSNADYSGISDPGRDTSISRPTTSTGVNGIESFASTPSTANSTSNTTNISSTSSYGPNFNSTPSTYSRNDNATNNSTGSTSPYGLNFDSTPSTYSRNDNTTSNSFNSVIESSHSRTNYYNTIGYDNYRNYLVSPGTWKIIDNDNRTIREPFSAEDCSYTKVKVHEIAREIMIAAKQLRSDITEIIDKLETAKESSKNAISIMGEPFGTNKIEMLIEVLRELPDDIVNRLENFALAPAVERCNEYQERTNREKKQEADNKCTEYNATAATMNEGITDGTVARQNISASTSYRVVEA